MTLSAQLERSLRDVFAPIDTRQVWQWAEDEIVLSRRQTETPGPYSTLLTPYVREPLECFSDPRVTDLTLCFGSQTSKTTILMIGAAWRMVNNPAPTIWVMPTEHLCRSFSENRWQPMVDDCHKLAALKPANHNRWKALEMSFRDATLTMVGSNSPASLASRPAGLLIMDETDKFALPTSREAGRGGLGREPHEELHQRPAGQASTPTTGEGEIWQAFTVDVQDAGGRHFWAVIRDWSKDGRSRGRWAGRVETWDDLEKIREENEIRPPCVFVDSAFASREVYFACCRFGWVALRGSDNESFTWNDHGRKVQRAYARPERGDPAGGGKWDAGTLARRTCPLIKFSAPTCEDILDALRRTEPPRWEFPKDFPLDWHEQMASTVKKRIRNPVTGATGAKWVIVKGRPNHLRDCEKMQVVAALLAKVLTPAAERPSEKASA
jgi:hypothetical protein